MAREGDSKLTNTGKIRYRFLKRWFKDPLVVLQMETHKETYCYTYGRGYYWDMKDSWRDTKIEDLTTLDINSKYKPPVGDADTCFRPLRKHGAWCLVLQIKEGEVFRDATVQDLLLRQYPTA